MKSVKHEIIYTCVLETGNEVMKNLMFNNRINLMDLHGIRNLENILWFLEECFTWEVRDEIGQR